MWKAVISAGAMPARTPFVRRELQRLPGHWLADVIRSRSIIRVMCLERKLKTALDEIRLLILGAQVLVGFQFSGTFQELFEELPRTSRTLQCVALFLITTTIGLLIAPSMRHRIVEGGSDSNKSLEAATLFAGVALLPLAMDLSLDVFVTPSTVTGRARFLFSSPRGTLVG